MQIKPQALTDSGIRTQDKKTNLNWGTVKLRILNRFKCLKPATRTARGASASIASILGIVTPGIVLAGIVFAVVAPLVQAQTTTSPASPVPTGGQVQALTPAPQTAPAQNAAAIRGQVADPSGAVIPGANVESTSSAASRPEPTASP
jgi:hypothetical protein